MTTSITNQCQILADLWIDYKTEQQFQDFIAYNDLGLPLAYAVSTEIVPLTPTAEIFIKETFEVLLIALGLTDDEDGFDSIDDILSLANQ
jgi:hypothetical protein